MRSATYLLAAAVLSATLAALPARTALAHGELDEQALAEFHLHLDDYREEVLELLAEVQPLVSAYDGNGDAAALADELIEHWEEVGVHGAIETYATITYPTVWQALISLQQAVAGDDRAAVVAAGDGLEAALWQSFGAVRLAAYQVTSDSGPVQLVGADAATGESAPLSGPETVDRIIRDLETAVSAYGDGNLERAERLIHDTYMSHFEGLEGDLIEYDPDLVSDLEKDFNANLPLLMQRGAEMADVRARLAAMTDQLEAARTLLEQAARTRSEVF